MNICGLQKLSLVDYPEKIACTIFVGGCNFACPYCHNSSLININATANIDTAEIFNFLKSRANLLTGVCISGGEPLLNEDIFNLIKNIKDLGFSVKIDTNGSFPDRLEFIIKNKLIDYIAMDIKTSLRNYTKIVNAPINLQSIVKSTELLLNNNFPFEFRTTLVKDLISFEDLIEIGKWLKGSEPYFLQQFRDSENVKDKTLSPWDRTDLLKAKEILISYIPNTKIREL